MGMRHGLLRGVARQMGMRHGLLRALRSSLPLRSALNERPPDVRLAPRNPKNTSNPPIFLRKMAPFRCFARQKVTLACASAARMTFCRLSHIINCLKAQSILRIAFDSLCCSFGRLWAGHFAPENILRL